MVSTDTSYEKNADSVEFCGKNQLSDFVWSLPPNLTQVYASDIKLDFDIPIIRFSTKNVVKVVDFSENGVKCFGGPIYGLTSLQTVDLSRNQCYRLNPYFFTQTPNLTTLLLSMNRLGEPLSNDTEGVIFSKLDHLKTLDLSSNYLKHLSEAAFKNNENLQVLNLSNNAFNTFLPILTFNRKLLILDLSNNLLVALSESTCNQFLEIKTINQSFTVNISGNNGFLCNCDTLYFLNFLLDRPEIFDGVESFRCQLENGSFVSYAGLAQVIEELELHCIVQSIFVGVLLAFFLLLGCLFAFGLYHFKRWKWKYLYYIGRSRLHIGSTHITYRPVAHVFITYDQENHRLRRTMRNLILPRLHQMGLTTVLGEIDFAGGPLASSIAGAVASTNKTLVFLTPEIFQDYHRRLEVNLTIMHEVQLGRPALVPVLYWKSETHHLMRQRPSGHNQNIPLEPVVGDRIQSLGRAATNVSRRHEGGRGGTQQIDDITRFTRLLRNFPPEIATFLKGQAHRCLVYTDDKECFWQHLKDVILAD